MPESTAAHPIQDTLWNLGSDDGGQTWPELKPGERAGRYYTRLGPPKHLDEEEQEKWLSGAPKTLDDAIEDARRG